MSKLLRCCVCQCVYRLPNGLRNGNRYLSNVAAAERRLEVTQNETSEVKYPPVKPKFPPFRPDQAFEGMDRTVAWYMYDNGQRINDEYSEAWERLEDMAGEEVQLRQRLRPGSPYPDPGELKFLQYVSKTHIVEDLPQGRLTACFILTKGKTCAMEKFTGKLYEDINIDDELACVWPLYREAVAHALHAHTPAAPELDVTPIRTLVEYRPERQAGAALSHALLEALVAPLSGRHRHLRGHTGKQARVQAWWLRHGYSDDEKTPIDGKLMVPHENKLWTGVKYTEEDIDSGCVTYDSRADPDLLMRYELPLPEFVPLTDPLVQKEVEAYPYHPKIHNAIQLEDKNIVSPGYKLGDPFQHHVLLLQGVDQNYDKLVEDFPDDVAHHQTYFVKQALMSGYLSCLSQAFGLGFGPYWELTYPITSQLLLTDGKEIQFVAYQLNTTLLWQPDTANQRSNLLWRGPLLNLYNEENNNVEVNQAVLRCLLKFLLNTPAPRGVELTPHLPHIDDEALLINDLDTPAHERKLLPKHPFKWRGAYYI